MSSNPLHPADPEQAQRERTEQIARLNDETRQGKARRSRILFTRGVVELLAEGQTEEPARTARVMINQDRLMRQIADAPIDPGDDPYGERDFGLSPSLVSACIGKSMLTPTTAASRSDGTLPGMPRSRSGS